jgi:uncharacterized protein with GYD domain
VAWAGPENEEGLMTMFLARCKISKEAMRALVEKPEDRLVTTTRFLKGIGGRLHNYYFAFGQYDIILLFDLPDHISASVLSMVLTSSGSCTEVETTVLLSMADAVDAMHKASEAMGVYSPPGRSSEAVKSKRLRSRPRAL